MKKKWNCLFTRKETIFVSKLNISNEHLYLKIIKRFQKFNSFHMSLEFIQQQPIWHRLFSVLLACKKKLSIVCMWGLTHTDPQTAAPSFWSTLCDVTATRSVWLCACCCCCFYWYSRAKRYIVVHCLHKQNVISTNYSTDASLTLLH